MRVETNRLLLESQINSGHTSEKIAKRSLRMDFQRNSSTFTPSDHSSILAFLHNFKFNYVSNEIDRGGTTWLLRHSIKEPAKAALSYQMSAAEENKTHKE